MAAARRKAATWSPTKDQRDMVRAMSGYGMPAADICRVVACGVSEHEFTQACADDLEQGQIQASAKLQEQLYTQAVNGNTAALLHLSRQSMGGQLQSVVSTAEMCSWLGISKVSLGDMRKRGVVSMVARDRWEVKKTVNAVTRHYREIAAGRKSAEDDDSPDLVSQRALLAKSQFEGQELKNAQLRRELAPISLIEWTLGKVGNQIGAVLDSIPLKVKKVVPRLTAVEVEHIKREVVKAQNAAARIAVDLDEYYDERDARSDN